MWTVALTGRKHHTHNLYQLQSAAHPETRMNTLRQFYMEIPIVTRAYTTVCVLTTLAVVSVLDTMIIPMHLHIAFNARWRVPLTNTHLMNLWQHLDLVSPLQLYFNPTLIVRKFQIWRLATTFLYFGTIGISFFFNMVFTYRYCRMLEDGSFRGRSSDFVMMFIFGGVLMTFFGIFVNLFFLGQAFTLMLVYVWSRRNPMVPMNFFGVLNFQVYFQARKLMLFL